MKKAIFYTLFALGMCFSACEEKQLVIPELSVGKKRVLVEEITGANCSNCPSGAQELAALQSQYGKDNLLIVSIHAGGTLSHPITGSKYDFQTNDGYDMTNYIGTLFGIPAASINRVEDPVDETPFLIGGWAANIANEFKKDYGLGVFVANTYNAETRNLDISVNIAPENAIGGENRLTVVITQDSIVDAQYDGVKIIPNYVHRHVFRDAVTKPDGEIIQEPLLANGLVQKKYSVKLPAEWEAKHCAVVAFVHRNQNNNKEILQAAEEFVFK
ncbi:MAG: Omp28-related outer membrane protein [Bacteroidetes bacterium]|nr:Omp28-related outer membrane protein [Bacteroidota bacterium]